jgi:hypothetical protein
MSYAQQARSRTANATRIVVAALTADTTGVLDRLRLLEQSDFNPLQTVINEILSANQIALSAPEMTLVMREVCDTFLLQVMAGDIFGLTLDDETAVQMAVDVNEQP